MNDYLYKIAGLVDKEQRQKIVAASVSTYNKEELSKYGLELDINTDANKRQSIGDPSNPLYPDIVIWKPSYKGSNIGTAVIAEKIETPLSLITTWQSWKDFANSGVVFNLVVPIEKIEDVYGKLDALDIRQKTNLQVYEYNTDQKKYIFTKAS